VTTHSRLWRSDSEDALYPVMPAGDEPIDWDGATWIGQMDHAQLDGDSIRLVDGERFGRARLLVWKDGRPRGSVEVTIHDGLIELAPVRREVREMPEPPSVSRDAANPPISIVICTRDRPDHLEKVLASLYGLDYPEFEVVVVDNNPASGLTAPAVEPCIGLPVRVIPAPRQGLSIARNVGIQNARYDLVAFTDDDVVLDRRWLTNLAQGFAMDERVACVCGMVPTSELLTPAQSYFDHRVGWAQRWMPAVYDLENHVGGGLFPLQISEFGTGANFAVRKDVVLALGGFDEALGAGAPAGSGEDIDMFLRIMLTGHLLAREPSAVVWHSHRRTVPELESQMYNYAVGLSAWLFKLLMRPRTLVLVVSRLFVGIRHLGRVTVVEDDRAVAAEPDLSDVKRRELAGLSRGPWRLVRGRLAGRRSAPLRPRSTHLRRLSDLGHRILGAPAVSAMPGRLAATAGAASVVGSLGAVEALPVILRTVFVAAFVLAGPGCLAMSFYVHLPSYAVAALVPVLGLATCILSVSGLLMAEVYSPATVLLGLALTTLTGALVRWGRLVAAITEPV
jgi:GT2 family glycosyltransferase